VEIVIYTVTNGHSVVSIWLRVLKILMFATHGEKDILKDKTINFNCCVIFMSHG
jgi:hypothetical protein